MKRSLLVFLKLPVPGRVKTRLARSVGSESAAEIYKRLVSRVLSQIRDAPFDSIRILFDPPQEETAVREWLASDLVPLRSETEITFIPQEDGDLGRRLDSAFADAFEGGFSQVAAIGTDCIDITPHHFSETWAALDGGSDAVFGPADDGGYYLIALSAPHPELFRSIPWSEPDTLEKSLEAAAEKRLSIHQLEKLEDIDQIEDWNRVRGTFE